VKPKPDWLQVKVECYSGYKSDQRPLKFTLGNRKYPVKEVLDQWYGPNDIYFKLRAEDGDIYILRHHQEGNEDFWSLESFRSEKRPIIK